MLIQMTGLRVAFATNVTQVRSASSVCGTDCGWFCLFEVNRVRMFNQFVNIDEQNATLFAEVFRLECRAVH